MLILYLICLCPLISVDMPETLPKKSKISLLLSSSKLFSIFVPLSAWSWNNICVFRAFGANLCILSFWYHWYEYYQYKMLNILVCTNEFIFSIFPLCSVLVYYGYTNANISSWLEGIWLDSIKHTILIKNILAQNVCIFLTPPLGKWAGCDSRSIFKPSLTGFILKFSLS